MHLYNYDVNKSFFIVKSTRSGYIGGATPEFFGGPILRPRRLGDRAFSVAGPVVWNSLPAAVREADSLHSFRRKLKTHLFTLCFDD